MLVEHLHKKPKLLLLEIFLQVHEEYIFQHNVQKI